MSYMVDGLKAGKLFFLVLLGLLAISAPARGAEFTIQGKTLEEHAISEEGIAGQGGAVQIWLSTTTLKVDCAKSKVDEGAILPGGISHMELQLSACELLLKGESLEGACDIVEPIMANLSSELVLHGGQTYSIFKALEGKNFMMLNIFKVPEGGAVTCIAQGEHPATGSAVASVQGSEAVEKPFTFSPAFDSLLGYGLSFGAAKLFFSGEMQLHLSGENEGFQWGAL